MIGIDTNILVRLFAEDDPVQLRLAKKFFSERVRYEIGYVSLIVIVELVWVLTRVYGFKKDGLLEVLTDLSLSDDIEIEQPEIFAEALRGFERTGGQFSDLLITCRALQAGCLETFTFDEGAAKKAGMTLLRDAHHEGSRHHAPES